MMVPVEGPILRMKLITIIVTIGTILAVLSFVLHPPSLMWSPRMVVGAVIAGLSFPFLLLAHWQLGASFSVSAKARALVTTGIYSKIRNPIYLFSLVPDWAIALSVYLGAVGGGRGAHSPAGSPCPEGRASPGGRLW
jgi:protein-S-isoprenylcysteine O-methyltransferase Ste14